ncbi:MAG: phosphatase PAP2 family protein [Bacteroidales bacterium]|jgi:hypothetical protein|nr:phosphatase PAP2 family protein [Bacteroidales bacterium]
MISQYTARIISIVFHPLFMPVYGMLLVFSAPTLFGYLPFQVKRLLVLIVLINNVMLPAALLPLFKYRQIISSWAIEKRSERVIPLLMTTLLYASTSFIIYRFPLPEFLKSFIIAAFFVSLAVTVVNFWWRISIHSAGAGALVGMVIILSFRMFTPLALHIAGTVAAAGLVMSSRLFLNSHSPSEVWTGFFTGLAVLILVMLLS